MSGVILYFKYLFDNLAVISEDRFVFRFFKYLF